MTASFIRVLILERMLYENETAYVDALERTWTSSIALRGFLLDGSLGSQNARSFWLSKPQWRRIAAQGRRKQADCVAFRAGIEIKGQIFFGGDA